MVTRLGTLVKPFWKPSRRKLPGVRTALSSHCALSAVHQARRVSKDPGAGVVGRAYVPLRQGPLGVLGHRVWS